MVLSVGDLNRQIKSLVESHFEIVTVEGEISQVTYHFTGHIYFTIKDAESSLSCAMWKSSAQKLPFKIEKGDKLLITGALSVYLPRGEYKLIAAKIEPSGIGALQLAYEKLKKELQEKGYFNQSTKKPLPKFPQTLAIITASGGAALQDMLKIASKRWPLIKISIFNALVQGEKAAQSIAEKIHFADERGYDLLIVGRGGGSIEDLWAFNEKIVVEAIYQANTPIISAVGHESDVLISDFVADVRASTPSNAIEISLPDQNDQRLLLSDQIHSLRYLFFQRLKKEQEKLSHLRSLYKLNSFNKKLDQKKEESLHLQKLFTQTMQSILIQKSSSLPKKESFDFLIKNFLDQKRKENSLLKEHFKLKNPEKELKKGYVQSVRNNTLISLKEVNEGERLDLLSSHVKLEVLVEKKSKF